MARVASLPDPRVFHRSAILNGHNYKFLYGEPQNGQWTATVFLIHGWPDLSMGWRNQIPLLVDLGLRVVAPDMMGYGGTDCPRVPPHSLKLYGMKRAADDMAELARQLDAPHIIVGGHDWGGEIVYRLALYHPQLVSHVFAVCTPYRPPSPRYMSLEDVVARRAQFGYQQQLAGPDVEAAVRDPAQIRQFLAGMFGARTPDRQFLFSPEKGVDFAVLPRLGASKLMSDAMMDYYVQEYARNGLHGPLNWYRTRRVNFEDEQSLSSPILPMSVLFIAGERDSVLAPSLSRGMEKFIPNLSRGSVPADHWALWQDPAGVNAILRDWFAGVVFGGKAKM